MINIVIAMLKSVSQKALFQEAGVWEKVPPPELEWFSRFLCASVLTLMETAKIVSDKWKCPENVFRIHEYRFKSRATLFVDLFDVTLKIWI